VGSTTRERTVHITWEDLQRTAEEAADIDALVRRELERAGQVDAAPLRQLKRDAWPQRPRWPTRVLVVLSLLGLGAIVSIDGREATSKPPQPSTSVVGPSPSPAAPAVSASPRPAREGLTARLVFSAPCWIQAVADGRTMLSKTMTGGTSVVRARRSLELTLGNAGGVRVFVNGRSFPTGSPGEVVHLLFTSDEGRVVVHR
jgi:hypothetical protein